MNYSVLSSIPVPRQDCVLRTMCILCGLGMVLMSVLMFVLYSSGTILDLLLKSYYMYTIYSFFGFVMIIIEFNFKCIKKYWRFLIEVFGKSMFYVL